MGTLAILLLIISGVLMIVSQGDDNQLEKAKTVFLYTLLGLAVGFLSYTIVRFIIDTLLS
jgi:glucose uptake protein GlcU